MSYARLSNLKADWVRDAEKLRTEAPRTAERMLREADQIDDMLNRMDCPQCDAQIVVPGDKYGKAMLTHEITCPYA